MSARPAAPPAAWAEVPAPPPAWRRFGSRIATLCLVELRKIRHDRAELYTRAIQPALWLLIFGETFTRIRAIPTGNLPYLDYLAPGIMAQSALTKLLATPTPRTALVAGKAFAAGVRATSQVVVVLVLSALLGVHLRWNPLALFGAVAVVVLGSAFFATLSVTLAGLVLSRERLMGIGQAITMPLFFGSNALYPVRVMPAWLRVVSHVNPLSYEVDALRALLLGTPGNLWLDLGALVAAAIAGVGAAAALLDRLAR